MPKSTNFEKAAGRRRVDCCLAVIAKENKAAVLTLDKHFSIIAEYI